MKAKLKVLKGPSAGKEIDIPVAKFFFYYISNFLNFFSSSNRSSTKLKD